MQKRLVLLYLALVLILCGCRGKSEPVQTTEPTQMTTTATVEETTQPTEDYSGEISGDALDAVSRSADQVQQSPAPVPQKPETSVPEETDPPAEQKPETPIPNATAPSTEQQPLAPVPEVTDPPTEQKPQTPVPPVTQPVPEQPQLPQPPQEDAANAWGAGESGL